MKKTAFVISVFLLISTSLLAQKKTTIKTDLFSPVIRTYTLKLERAFTEEIAVQLGFFYSGFNPRESETTLRGYGITPEFRFYLSDTPAPNGTYLAPNIRYFRFSVTDPLVNEEGALTNLSLAINLGKQAILKDIIVIDAWIGPSYNFRSISETSADFDAGIANVNGFGLRVGIAIGLAF